MLAISQCLAQDTSTQKRFVGLHFITSVGMNGVISLVKSQKKIFLYPSLFEILIPLWNAFKNLKIGESSSGCVELKRFCHV